ncbi:diguanylate cyclase (GGDEF)-like protein [Clostridium punense]|uniref:Diguanylate cyclase (GGDEF)-like protein n=1 Tax=Clostridium punense TaxID=1054297 RepID=A0ABS4K749_9CLOT|nr:diguanylate cyclase (GGDEF)-like protein [Clostridium punense]
MENNYEDKIQEEIHVLLNRSWDLFRTDIKETLPLIEKAEDLSKNINYEKGLTLSQITLARYCSFQGKYDEALEMAHEGSNRATAEGNLEGEIKAAYVLGNLYNTLGNSEAALSHYTKGFALMKKNNYEIDAAFLNNIAVIYYNFGQFDESLEFLQEALDISTKTEDKIESLILSNIADTYHKKGDIQSALKWNKRALETFKLNGKKGDVAQCYNTFGLIYGEMKLWDKALENFQTALNIYKESEQKYFEIEMLYNIGKLYALQNENHQAVIYLNQAAQEAEKIKAHGLLNSVYRTLSETYEKEGEYKQAFHCLKVHNELEEKIKTKELNNKLAKHATQYKIERAKQDAEIQRLKNEELKRKSEEDELKTKVLEEAYEDIKIIGEIVQQITATLDIEKVLFMIYKNIGKLMAADVFGICLCNKENESVDFKILMEQGEPRPLYSLSINDEKSYAARCIREKKEIFIKDLMVDGEKQIRFGANSPSHRVKSMIYYPLIIEEEVIGAMTVQSYRDNAHSNRSLEMIKALGAYIAIALNNSQKSEDLKAKKSELELLSKTDSLTGIYNRYYIMKKIKEEVEEYSKSRKAFSIVMLDIDYFKTINDVYGHNCGDYILVELSNMVNSILREQDVFARWGGEEFLMLLPDTNHHQAAKLCERLREKVESYNFFYNGNKINTTITFGVAQYNERIGVNSTIKNADLSMYRGKHNGRNCVICSH